MNQIYAESNNMFSLGNVIGGTVFIYENDYIREDVDDVDAIINKAIDAAVEDLKDDIEHTANEVDNLTDNDEN